jgi:hypothetical protein
MHVMFWHRRGDPVNIGGGQKTVPPVRASPCPFDIGVARSIYRRDGLSFDPNPTAAQSHNLIDATQSYHFIICWIAICRQ